MSWTDGEVINTEARLRRLSSAIPPSYTIFKIGSTYYAETNIAGGTNYSNADAETVIRQAIDALASGGKIFLRPATYNLADELGVNTLNNIILEGAGYGTYLHLNNGVNKDAFEIYNSNHITIRNMRIDGNNANNSGTIYALLINTSNYVTLENLWVEDGNVDNLAFIDATRCFARNIVSTESTNVGIVTNAASSDILIDGVISYGEPTAVEVHSDYTSIQNVEAISPTSWAISNAEGTHNIYRNIICRTPDAGMLVDTGSAHIAINNLIVDGATCGTGLYGLVMRAEGEISNCYLEGTGVASTVGMLVEHDDVVISNCTVKNWDSSGIWLSNDEITVTGCHCYDDQGVKTQNYGLVLHTSSSNCTITGNNLRENAMGAIYLTGTDHKIRSNNGYNWMSATSYGNPFDVVNDWLIPSGGTATPSASTDYVVKMVDIIISSTDSGNADCAIQIQDPAGNNVNPTTLSTINCMFIPIDYKINWGAYTGVAPTVVVASV